MSSEEIDEAAEHLERSDEDVTSGQRQRAFWVLATFFSLAVISILAAVYVGMIDVHISLTLEANLSWVVEYTVAAIAGLGVLFLVSSFLIWLPGSFLSGMAHAAFGIALGSGLINGQSLNGNQSDDE